MSTERTRLGGRELTLLAASSLTVMAGATIAPALPDMQHAFRDVPDVELLVKLVMTLPALFIVLGAPLIGTRLDRGRKRPILIAALVGYALAGSSGLLAGSLHGVLVGRALLGLAVAGVMTSCTTLASFYFAGPLLGRFMGLQAAVGGFGGVLFLVLGGALAELGWRAPFALYLIALAVVPLAVAALDEPDPVQPGACAERSGDRAALAWTRIALAYALALLEIALLYLVPVHYPFFARSLEPVTAAQTGVAIATLLLVMALVSSSYSRLGARLRFATLHGVGLGLLGVGYLLLGRADSYLETYPGLVVAGAGLGVLRPNLMVWLMSLAPPALRGRVLGGVTTFFFLGQFASPLLSGWSVGEGGLGLTFVRAGALGLAVAGLFVAFVSLHGRGSAAPLELPR